MFSIVAEHPLATLLIFVATTSAIIVLLSGQESGLAVRGILEVLWSILTTPFRFLRRVLEMMKTIEARDTPYVGSRAHISFRANRIQYVFVFLTALLLLSGGVASSILALYPKAELELRDSLGNDLKELEGEIAEQQRIVADAAKPDYKETLTDRLRLAKAASDKASVQLRQYFADAPYSGGWLKRMEQAEDVDTATTLAAELDGIFEGCPDNSSEFDRETCLVLEKHARGLAPVKLAQLKAAEEFAEARESLEAADAAADNAKRTMSELENRQAVLKEAYEASSLLNFGWVKSHVGAAVALLLPTLVAVIAYVWAGAILADVIGWLIMMMLALERRFADDGDGNSATATQPAAANDSPSGDDAPPGDDSPRDLRQWVRPA